MITESSRDGVQQCIRSRDKIPYKCFFVFTKAGWILVVAGVALVALTPPIVDMARTLSINLVGYRYALMLVGKFDMDWFNAGDDWELIPEKIFNKLVEFSYC